MVGTIRKRVAIVYPGDSQVRRDATPVNNRFAELFQALTEAGIEAVPAVYNDDFCGDVREQLLHVDAALVWVNPIEGGRDRTMLDGMLREVADAGVFVSAHPDAILAMGTKEVLYKTRDAGWGSDVDLYRDLLEMKDRLSRRLAQGDVRVLKQYRGHSGIGVWKVEAAFLDEPNWRSSNPPISSDAKVRVRHAQRGSLEEVISLGEFLARCESYFANGGCVIDQAYQERLTEGMFRCYLVHDKVAGFGFQAINALFPAQAGLGAADAPQPGPRLYYPPTMAEAQALKQKMEMAWLPALQQVLGIDRDRLPVLWDADFLLGPKDSAGVDTYVLCEINVSSVAPYPESAIPFIVDAMRTR